MNQTFVCLDVVGQAGVDIANRGQETYGGGSTGQLCLALVEKHDAD